MRYKSFAIQALFIAFIFLVPHLAFTQVYSNKEVGKKNSQRIDSLKKTEYPYILPILGKQATKRGFSLPYSAGIGINYLWQKSDLVINNLQVGFNNNPPQNMDQIIRFNNATSEAVGLNIRPDVWLLPFLNVYAIFAQSKPSTSVDFGIYSPVDGSNIINLNTKANFQATTFGLGVTPTLGIGGGWMALDMNFTWNDIPELDKPAFAFVFGPRFGKTFKLRAPEKSVAFWAGGFRLHLNSGTSGSIPLNQFIDTNGLQEKVDAGIAKVDASQQQLDAWWNGLPTDGLNSQNSPANIAKHETANKALGAAGNFLNGLDESLTNVQNGSVQYSLDKRPKDMWNFIVGGQYQHNKHWMIRGEFGFLGSRQQLITGVQYRFGL